MFRKNTLVSESIGNAYVSEGRVIAAGGMSSHPVKCRVMTGNDGYRSSAGLSHSAWETEAHGASLCLI